MGVHTEVQCGDGRGEDGNMPSLPGALVCDGSEGRHLPRVLPPGQAGPKPFTDVRRERDGPGKHSGPLARADIGRGDDHCPVARTDDGAPLPWPPVPLLGALCQFYAEHGQDG